MRLSVEHASINRLIGGYSLGCRQTRRGMAWTRVVLPVLVVVVVSCDPGSPSSPAQPDKDGDRDTTVQDTSIAAQCRLENDSLDCECIADRAIGSSGAGPVYRVLYPGGGEVLHVGDTVQVIITARLNGNARVFLEYENGKEVFPLPGANRNLDPRRECSLEFVVPESFVDEWNPPDYTYSALSDSVRLRVEDYMYPQVDEYAVSDGFFTIAE